jgi:hypothetical protein
MNELSSDFHLAQGLVEKHGTGVRWSAIRQSVQPPQKRCVVCAKHGKRKQSISWRSECEAGLCIDECFKKYHTKLNF